MMLRCFIISLLIVLAYGSECGEIHSLTPGKVVTVSSQLLRSSIGSDHEECLWKFSADKEPLNVLFSCNLFHLPGSRSGKCDSHYLKVNNKIFCGADKINEKISASQFNIEFSRKNSNDKDFSAFHCRLITTPDGSVIRSQRLNQRRLSRLKLKSHNFVDSQDATQKDSVTPRSFGCNCEVGNDNQVRVVGGTNAKIEKYPFFVSLRFYGQVFCGGSVVSERFVVTAAHCLVALDKELYKVVVGATSTHYESTLEAFSVKKIIVHDKYNKNKLGHDIGLIELDRPIEFSSSVKSICLSAVDDVKDKLLIVGGWGRIEEEGPGSDNLLVTEIHGISREECFEKFEKQLIDDTMVCAFDVGHDACKGDSGGPLVLMVDGVPVLYGLVSFGVGCASEYPGVYTDVSYFNDWITKNVHDLC